MSESVLPMFSSKIFIVSGLMFRSLIHFELIFVYGVREWDNLILLHVAVQYPQHHLLKRLSFFCCISWLLCYSLGDHRCMCLSLGFLSWSIDLYFCFCVSTILSWLLWLCSIVWSQETWFLQCHSFFSRLHLRFGVFCVSIQIGMFFVLILWKMPLVV